MGKEIRPARILLDRLHEITAAAKVVSSFVDDNRFSAYQRGWLDAIETLQNVQEPSTPDSSEKDGKNGNDE